MPKSRLKRNLINIALVDDHGIFRDGVSRYLNAISDFSDGKLVINIPIEAKNGKDFISQVTNNNIEIDLVILDINMPEMGGLETLRWIKENRDYKVLMLTMYSDPSMVTSCMKEGADGYLTKDSSTKKLKTVIESILEFGHYYDDFITTSLIETVKKINYNKDNFYGEAILATKILTEREKEVLKWLASGLGYKEIAEKMGISPRTLEGYRDELFNKFDTNTRVGVVVNAIKYGALKFHEL
jgi:two-component system, NarL family, invasion response regulator UvrY